MLQVAREGAARAMLSGAQHLSAGRRFRYIEDVASKGYAMLRRYIREGCLFRENAAAAVGL